MRIVVAHSRLASLGGGERATLEVLRHLSARHDVELWTSAFDARHTYAGLADFPRRELPPGAWLTARAAADAVVAQNFGAWLLALHSPRVVCYVHTLRSRYLAGGVAGVRPDLAARRALDRLALRRAACVLANSAYTAERVRRRIGRAVTIAPPGVDAAFFASTGAPGDYALYVGRLAPEKGIERLLRWHAGIGCALVLAGAGTAGYVARLRQLAGPGVRFAGALDGQALLDAYAGCRYLAFLPHQEEFGLAALEAMAMARPVVAVAEGGLPELVADGATGALVADSSSYARAARRLLDDAALAARLGQTGRARAQAYTWERHAAIVAAACVTAATRGRAPAGMRGA